MAQTTALDRKRVVVESSFIMVVEFHLVAELKELLLPQSVAWAAEQQVEEGFVSSVLTILEQNPKG